MNDEESSPELKGLISDIINKYLNFIDANILKDFIFDLIGKNYNDGLEAGGIQFNQNFVPSYETVSFIQKYAFDNVKGLTDEMKDKLRKEMSQGLMNQEGIPQLKLRILDVMDITIQRAEMIARTESVRAFNMGHYAAAKESGLEVRKQWNAQPERTSHAGNLVPCPHCEAMDGTIIDMNDKFRFTDGEELLLPPKHPRCACRVLYIQQ